MVVLVIEQVRGHARERAFIFLAWTSFQNVLGVIITGYPRLLTKLTPVTLPHLVQSHYQTAIPKLPHHPLGLPPNPLLLVPNFPLQDQTAAPHLDPKLLMTRAIGWRVLLPWLAEMSWAVLLVSINEGYS